MTTRNAPPGGAIASLAANHNTTERTEARDRLHAQLDALGGRTPTDTELRSLLQTADDAFHPKSAAWRLMSALVRALGEAKRRISNG